ncbi:MAG: prephenate dehydrogenase [Endomicrobium sp.]|jgi:prephenate dehydrogenase|nr:prephenate dehydrogenase [Endomicrobium sp.]
MSMLNLCIIGLGQIGGSLGLALKKNKAPYHITGIVRRTESAEIALKLGIVDEVYLNLKYVKNSDIIVICTPVDMILYLYKKIYSIVDNNKDVIITDVGSVKYSIEKKIKNFMVKKNKSISFVGTHPMIGKENNGIFSADADMFKNANVVITGVCKKMTKKEILIFKMWKYVGANVFKMSSQKHDKLVAFTSHLPHVVAFLLKKMYKKIKKKDLQISMLVSSSFKSATRVAVSGSNVWAPIFKLNGKNIEKYLFEFINELNNFKQILNDKKKIETEILSIQK